MCECWNLFSSIRNPTLQNATGVGELFFICLSDRGVSRPFMELRKWLNLTEFQKINFEKKIFFSNASSSESENHGFQNSLGFLASWKLRSQFLGILDMNYNLSPRKFCILEILGKYGQNGIAQKVFS